MAAAEAAAEAGVPLGVGDRLAVDGVIGLPSTAEGPAGDRSRSLMPRLPPEVSELDGVAAGGAGAVTPATTSLALEADSELIADRLEVLPPALFTAPGTSAAGADTALPRGGCAEMTSSACKWLMRSALLLCGKPVLPDSLGGAEARLPVINADEDLNCTAEEQKQRDQRTQYEAQRELTVTS